MKTFSNNHYWDIFSQEVQLDWNIFWCQLLKNFKNAKTKRKDISLKKKECKVEAVDNSLNFFQKMVHLRNAKAAEYVFIQVICTIEVLRATNWLLTSKNLLQKVW